MTCARSSMDRALAFGARRWEFDSPRARFCIFLQIAYCKSPEHLLKYDKQLAISDKQNWAISSIGRASPLKQGRRSESCMAHFI